MPIRRHPIQKELSGIFGLILPFLGFSLCLISFLLLLLYYGIQFCAFVQFLCVQIYVSLHLYVFLVFLWLFLIFVGLFLFLEVGVISK